MFDSQVQYWATMLNEAMTDKAGNDISNHNKPIKIDERRMDGPAAAAKGGKDEIAEFRKMLRDGVVEFEFRKADGSLRHAIGTTSETVVPVSDRKAKDPNYDKSVASYSGPRSAYIIAYWDLEKNAWRCFNTNRFEGLIKFEPTAKHIDDNVTKVGDIFIHKDIDSGMNDPTKISVEKAEATTKELKDAFTSAGSDVGVGAAILDMGWISGSGISIDDFDDIGIEVGPSGEPILRMVIRKHGTDGDQPYALRINALRKAILEKYNVNVKKVIIDGEFQF